MCIRFLEEEMADRLPTRHVRSSITERKENIYRKANKQLMEKRRRARINSCLNQLKALVLSGQKTEAIDVSKLEKADILEMAVKYVKALHNGPSSHHGTDEKTVPDERYKNGYKECAKQVFSYLGNLTDVTKEVRTNMMRHLADYAKTRAAEAKNDERKIEKMSTECTPQNGITESKENNCDKLSTDRQPNHVTSSSDVVSNSQNVSLPTIHTFTSKSNSLGLHNNSQCGKNNIRTLRESSSSVNIIRPSAILGQIQPRSNHVTLSQKNDVTVSKSRHVMDNIENCPPVMFGHHYGSDSVWRPW